MNRLIIFVLILFPCFQAIGQYDFEAKNSTVTDNILKFHFLIDNVRGVAGTTGGKVLKSNDEGDTWTHVANIPLENGANYSNDIGAIHYYDINNMILGTFLGQVFTSNDGGYIWTSVYNGPDSLPVYDDAYYPADTKYFLSRYNGNLLYTTNQGLTWDSLQTPSAYGVSSIDIHAGSGLGFVVGQGATMDKTNNGGLTWTAVSGLPTSYDLKDVCVIDASRAIAVGAGGTILVTINGGLNWTPVSTTITADLYAVDMFGNDGVVVGLGGVVYETTDGGMTWSENLTHDYSGSTDVYTTYVMNTYKAAIGGASGSIEMAPAVPFEIEIGNKVSPDSACVGVNFTYSFWAKNLGPQDASNFAFNALCNGVDFFGGEIPYPGTILAGDSVIVNITANYSGVPGLHAQIIYAKYGNPPDIIGYSFGANSVEFGTSQPYDITGSVNFCPGDTVVVEASGGNSYYWQNTPGSDPYNPTQEVYPFQTQSYVVEIYQQNCKIVDSVTLYLDPNCVIDSIIPSPAPHYAFSPNNDGVNDYLVLDFLDPLATNNFVSIINRWGDIVFETENYNNTDVYWDGTYDSHEPLAGTYFFVVETDAHGRLTGWIQVVK